jgi:glutathione peroxidase
MKKILLFAIFTSFIGCKNQETSSKSRLLAANETKQEIMEKETIYQYKTVDLSGKPFDFATLKGKKILIVNTASKCGYTKQYADLEAIYKKYQTKNFVIVGFPANNFGAQEPGTNQEIQSFCQLNYGVTFPMMEKVSVKGSDMCEIYQFLTQKSKNGVQDSQVQWNFQKYLINTNGELEKVLLSDVKPTDAAIIDWIEKQ